MCVVEGRYDPILLGCPIEEDVKSAIDAAKADKNINCERTITVPWIGPEKLKLKILNAQHESDTRLYAKGRLALIGKKNGIPAMLHESWVMSSTIAAQEAPEVLRSLFVAR